jgi:hypothetical protein
VTVAVGAGLWLLAAVAGVGLTAAVLLLLPERPARPVPPFGWPNGPAPPLAPPVPAWQPGPAQYPPHR